MKNKILIGLLTFIWLVLMVDIIWKGTEGNWRIEDAEKIGQLKVAQYTNQVIVVAVSDVGVRLCMYERNCVDELSWDDRNQENSDKVQNTSWKLVLETDAIIGKNG